jgi:hypothetical protein
MSPSSAEKKLSCISDYATHQKHARAFTKVTKLFKIVIMEVHVAIVSQML